MIKLYDIGFYPEFGEDLELIPENIQERLFSRVGAMWELINQGSGIVLGSFNAHKIQNTEVWIGHLTNGGQAYRILFEMDSKGCMWIWRIMTHKQMDEFISSLY